MRHDIREFIKQWYLEKGPGWCAAQLNEPAENIKQIAFKMGFNHRKARLESVKKYLTERLALDGWRKAAEHLDIPESCVRKWADRLAIEKPPDRRGNYRSLVLSNQRRSFIIEQYPEKTARECAIELGISEDRVYAVVAKAGIPHNRRARTRHSKSVNAEFFDTWTKESAYILGFIYADGCIQRDLISLFQNEIYFLEMIRRIMKIKNEIKNHGIRCHAVRFNCCYLADRLREIGIRERKSFGNMIFPLELPDSLYSHFFRGYFDGDGSVGIYGKYRSLRISFVGQKDFIERMYLDVNRLTGAEGGGVNKGTSKREYFYVGAWQAIDDTVKIYRWIYKDCGELLLRRKKEVFERWASGRGLSLDTMKVGDGDRRAGRRCPRRSKSNLLTSEDSHIAA